MTATAAPRGYLFRTARLGFGRWTADDLALAWALWGDPDVTRFIGGPLTREQASERLAREIETMDAYGVQYWPLFLLGTGAHAGCGGLRPYKPDDAIWEMGFHLRPEHWGRGLAEEAGRRILEHAFGALGAEAVFAGHHPGNAASRRVLEKLGMRRTHDEVYPPTGLRHPSYLLPRPR